MMIPFDKLVLVAVVLSAGSVVQGAVGFASGMICLPLLVLNGLTLPEAVTINVVSTSVQNVIGAWRLRRSLVPRELVVPVTLRWLGVPIGAFVLSHVDNLDPGRAKQLVGMLLLAVVVLLGSFRVKPRDDLKLGWQTLAFLSSGVMLGFAAIGGAPMVLYVNALTWSANKSRAFLFFCSATGIPVVAGLLWWN
ncbi:MAG: TSUP family transporter, partial [Planctomycetota bacterium]